MRSTLFVFLFCLCAVSAFSQQASPTPELYSSKTIAELKKLQKAAIESNYAYRRVGYLSNNIGPRLTGSPQAARAVEYIADEMRKAGMECWIVGVLERWSVGTLERWNVGT